MTEPIKAERLSRVYARRFAGQTAARQRVWRTICRVALRQWIPETADVLDLGGGYGEFINNIKAGSKYVLDLNPDTRENVNNDVEVFLGVLHDYVVDLENRADVIFSSNFLEHLPDKESLLELVDDCARVVRPGGRVIFLGPNISAVGSSYWDFVDHNLPLNEVAVREALQLAGMEIVHCQARFLPYSFKQRLPTYAWLVALYLRCPPAQWLFGKQYLVIGEKAGT